MQHSRAEDEAIYVTLGREGTNHDFVLRNHLRERRSKAQILYAADASGMLERCVKGDATHLMICAAHPDAAEMVAIAQYVHGILLTDTFIASSEALAVLRRSDIERPRTIALHPATRPYMTLSEFDEVIEVNSTVAAFEGLLQRNWDSALTQRRYANANGVMIVRPIEAARDAWLVLSREGIHERHRELE
ncbi:hypothetical protein [uncultured Roseibium sp.]|uniref:hypothetical protein n=1 Tax=uncultured Roseibium sp. TaxID=1936171 RepID=UPI00260C1039|nr:hypothetical protein [uncultured Roseibium sp.]